MSTAWRAEDRRAGVLPAVVIAYAIALIVYLPLETGLIGGLPPIAYWILRLLPDALVVGLALAVMAFGDRHASTTPVRLLWALGVICLAVLTVNAVRGISISDSINASRLVVRYMALGLLVWWAAQGRVSVAPLVVLAIFSAGLVELAIVGAHLMMAIIDSVGSATRFDPSSLLYVAGSTGRYDRLGLLLMSVAIAALATSNRISRGRLALIAACMAVVYLSTSRQAAVGLAVACTLLAFFPRVSPGLRGLAASLAAVSLVVVLIAPGQEAMAASVDEDGMPASAPTPTPALTVPTVPPAPTRKDSIRLTLDANRNFRLFYNLVIAPWAAFTQPVIGFGPRQQLAEHPDPRLVAQFENAGMSWSFARGFTNDSNYASLVIQFGAIVPAMFLLFILIMIARISRTAMRQTGTFARFAIANAAAVLVAAAFGPAFEMRPVAIIFWVSLMSAMAMLPIATAKASGSLAA